LPGHRIALAANVRLATLAQDFSKTLAAIGRCLLARRGGQWIAAFSPGPVEAVRAPA